MSEEFVIRYGRALGLEPGTAEMTQLLDMAATERGKLPPDIYRNLELTKTLPLFFRTVRRQKVNFEEDVRDRFQAYLFRERGISYLTTDCDVIVDRETGRNFDYELTPVDPRKRKIALEIFRMVSREESVAEDRTRFQIWDYMKKELDKRGIKDFAIDTPMRFQIPKIKCEAFCQRMADSIEAVVKKNPSIEKFEVEGFAGQRYEGLGTVVFSATSGGAMINPAATAGDAFAKKLPDKDSQLPRDGYERVILAVNWVLFLSADDAIAALAEMNLSFLVNTDYIYFETAPENFVLVYDRTVRRALDEVEDPPTDAPAAKLYHAWLENRLVGRDLRSFKLVQEISARIGNTRWLPSSQAREGVIWTAVDLVKSGAVNDGLWVARHFKNDPAPLWGTIPMTRRENTIDTKQSNGVRTLSLFPPLGEVSAG